jgi:hypothetical protein
MIRDALGSVSKVECVFVKQTGSLVSILFVLSDKERELRNRLFNLETEIIDAFPETSFEFEIVFLHGRKLRDVASPIGQEVLLRPKTPPIAA